MTFEKALEAMKMGKAVKYKNGNTKYIYNASKKKYQGFSEFCKEDVSEDFFSMLFNDVWEICELDYGCLLNVKEYVDEKKSEKKVEPDAFKNLRCDINPMSYDEWKEAHIDAREYKKRIAELETENAELHERLEKTNAYFCLTKSGLIAGKTRDEAINNLVDKIGELGENLTKKDEIFEKMKSILSALDEE